MLTKPQIISKDGIPQFVVLPYDEYQNILNILEEIEDIEDLKKAESNNEEYYPLDIVHRIAEGENAIKVFREFRNISQVELAQICKISKQYMSQIENNERNGSIKIIKSIAKALKVDIDDIID